MRERLVEELVKEIYGPRYGPEEIINGNPTREYVTGIIVPKSFREEKDNPDLDITSSSGEDIKSDDDSSDDTIFQSSELDPKKRPSSFGISFIVRSIDFMANICTTWGRYSRQNGDKQTWKRRSNRVITKIPIGGENTKETLIYKCDDGSIILNIRSVIQATGDMLVIVTLINDLVPADPKNLAEVCLFQPSIRINVDKTIDLVSINIREHQVLSSLYRKRPALARGYMCSAVWRQIDYHQYFDSFVLWPDGYNVTECHEFVEPSVRTEFIPLYPIPSPELRWDVGLHSSPELHAITLSEMWADDEIERYLLPLVSAYKKWIESNRQELLSEKQNNLLTLIDLQYVALGRMEQGIEILKKDTDARFSFCFANRVIHLQRSWRSGGDTSASSFEWYPFQLAFILMNIEALFSRESKYRDILDLLWIPTGGGKTEAYLALMAFVMALRRRRGSLGGGTSVITRYTLRLLTVQQFRRTLAMVTAAEYLRIAQCKGKTGWRPLNCDIDADWILGSMRFSVGLWVGTALSPNHLRRKGGAIDALVRKGAEGEPAQVIKCPACGSWLAIPKSGLPAGKNTLHLVVQSSKDTKSIKDAIQSHRQNIQYLKSFDVKDSGHSPGYLTVTLELETSKRLTESEIDQIFEAMSGVAGVSHASLSTSRPGYFGIPEEIGRRIRGYSDFEIYCPNPRCQLNHDICYKEGVPANSDGPSDMLPDGLVVRRWHSPFSPSARIPIPAYTTEEQVYFRCPTIVVSTADKIARLAFEPRSASIFGNVDKYNAFYGYYREDLFPSDISKAAIQDQYNLEVQGFSPPDLIVQDELHLLEGPLGSMFGLYEAIVDSLMAIRGGKPKRIASTATARDVERQIKSLFAEDVFQFPPHGIDIDDSFFVRNPADRDQIWSERRAGRLYLGVYAPKMGPLTPVIRIFSRLLKTCKDLETDPNVKYYWTVVEYFNAIRELGGGRAIYREDIFERLGKISSSDTRSIDFEKVTELSSRINSTDIPQILEELESCGKKAISEHPDAIFTTSMFGTGVDVPHLSLMIVNGQPKTSSQYIQATGRVGREHGGLVIAFYRAGRPRDLSHYEMFSLYHSRTHLEVEPPSVSPFSDGALVRGSGPATVSFMRNMANPLARWYGTDGKVVLEQEAGRDLDCFLHLLSKRIALTDVNADKMISYFKSQIERWMNIARIVGKSDLDFSEYNPFRDPTKSVVLGDPLHQYKDSKLKVVFKNAPQSLREIEETIGLAI